MLDFDGVAPTVDGRSHTTLQVTAFPHFHYVLFARGFFLDLQTFGDLLVASCTDYKHDPLVVGEYTLKNLNSGPLTFLGLALCPSTWSSLLGAWWGMSG